MYVWERLHVQGRRIPGRARRRQKFTDSYPFKTACTEVGGGSGRRTDMTFLDFWSTSSALYEVDEGLKDAGAAPASFKPSSGA